MSKQIGRPFKYTSEERVGRYTLWLTPTQNAYFRELGGSRWLQSFLDKHLKHFWHEQRKDK